jgi:DNA-binding GntR family transcriptional regulator
MNLEVRNIADQIVDLLRERILSGNVRADAPIRQDALASEFGVSKIPLREALARLEQDGLLISQPHRGYFVRPMTLAEVEDIYALRLKIEPDAVATAAKLATQQDRELATKALTTFKREAASRNVSGGTHNRAFHLTLVRPCRQNVTIDILERLHVLSDRYVCKHLEPLGRNARADSEHDGLLETWLVNDTKRLTVLAYMHIANTLEDLRQQLT